MALANRIVKADHCSFKFTVCAKSACDFLFCEAGAFKSISISGNDDLVLNYYTSYLLLL